MLSLLWCVIRLIVKNKYFYRSSCLADICMSFTIWKGFRGRNMCLRTSSCQYYSLVNWIFALLVENSILVLLRIFQMRSAVLVRLYKSFGVKTMFRDVPWFVNPNQCWHPNFTLPPFENLLAFFRRKNIWGSIWEYDCCLECLGSYTYH